MNPEKTPSLRVLVIDDNRSIHEDFRKILCVRPTFSASNLEAELFGATEEQSPEAEIRLHSAFQGQEGLALVEQSLRENDPYLMAFVDVRMPPGWDGIETTERIWACDPELHVVICTAYADYSWDQLRQKFPHNDQLLILKKPFDNVEVLQLAHVLSEKTRRLREMKAKIRDLEQRLYPFSSN